MLKGKDRRGVFYILLPVKNTTNTTQTYKNLTCNHLPGGIGEQNATKLHERHRPFDAFNSPFPGAARSNSHRMSMGARTPDPMNSSVARHYAGILLNGIQNTFPT